MLFNVDVKFTDASGEPLTEEKLSVTPLKGLSGNDPYYKTPWFTSETDNEGNFNEDLPFGDYIVSVFVDKKPSNIGLKVNTTPSFGNRKITTLQNISFVLKDIEGNVVPNKAIFFKPNFDVFYSSALEAVVVGNTIEAETNSEGVVDISLNSGLYTLTVDNLSRTIVSPKPLWFLDSGEVDLSGIWEDNQNW